MHVPGLGSACVFPGARPRCLSHRGVMQPLRQEWSTHALVTRGSMGPQPAVGWARSCSGAGRQTLDLAPLARLPCHPQPAGHGIPVNVPKRTLDRGDAPGCFDPAARRIITGIAPMFGAFSPCTTTHRFACAGEGAAHAAPDRAGHSPAAPPKKEARSGVDRASNVGCLAPRQKR